MKICTKCGVEKSLNQFKKNKLRKDGRTTKCKLCYKKYLREYNQENKEEISLTRKAYYEENKEICLKRIKNYNEKEPWKRVYYNAKARCENPNNSRYKYYGGRGIKFLLTMKQVKFLWFRDKAYFLDIPSIDRIENNGHYTLDNCRFIEHVDNVIKGSSKPILQLSKAGKLIKKWDSIGEASKKLNINRGNIGQCAKKQIYKTVGGFQWIFPSISKNMVQRA